MVESPEIVKLIKYVLFVAVLSHVIATQGQPLVTKPPRVVPVPFYHSEEVRSDLISSFAENQEGLRNGPPHHTEIQTKQDDLDPDVNSGLVERNSGGHKETRQAPQAPSDLQRSLSGPLPHHHHSRRFGPGPGSGEGLGSLCSIFRTFLEPRRFPRCHVSSRGEPQQSPPPEYYDRDRDGTSGLNGPLPSNELNHESRTHHYNQQQRRPLLPNHRRSIDDFLREMDDDRNNNNNEGEGPSDLSNVGPSPSIPPQSIANKRYDHIEDIQINHSGELLDGSEHNGNSGYPGPPPPGHQQQDPTKISQDRTMIVVPERNCPPGQRRDSRGYCRRLVKIRTNYHYGPPPGAIRPIPIRYYYSRIVAIPALHFFFPNV